MSNERKVLFFLMFSPPLTSPFVQTADIDKVVNHVTTAERTMITVDQPIPACPPTHVRRKYNMTPQMLRRHRSMTPLIQPNLGATLAFLSFLGWMTISSLPTPPFSIFSTSWGTSRGCVVNKYIIRRLIIKVKCWSRKQFYIQLNISTEESG